MYEVRREWMEPSRFRNGLRLLLPHLLLRRHQQQRQQQQHIHIHPLPRTRTHIRTHTHIRTRRFHTKGSSTLHALHTGVRPRSGTERAPLLILAQVRLQALCALEPTTTPKSMGSLPTCSKAVAQAAQDLLQCPLSPQLNSAPLPLFQEERAHWGPRPRHRPVPRCTCTAPRNRGPPS